MEIVQDTTEFWIDGKCAVAIGKFDGIHRGHEKLLAHILEQKKRGMKAVVFTFYPSASAFFGQSGEGELTTREEKRKLFAALGIDILIEFPLHAETAAILPEIFVREILVRQIKTAYLAAGADVSFGYQGKGDRTMLEAMSKPLGYQVEIIDKLFYQEREISATLVREAVEAGNMELAGKLLGRPYSFDGVVEQGNHLGRRLGMPTLNLYPKPEKLLPPMGVYFSRVSLENASYAGITNIGCKPTVKRNGQVSVETYLYDFDRELYGQEITISLLQFQRREMEFPNLDALKAQMERDIEQGREFHGTGNT